MKRLVLTLALLTTLTGVAYSGTPSMGKEMKQAAAPPCDQYYSDNEWNVQLWGTYAFTGTEYSPNADVADLIQSTTEGSTVLGSFDKYIGDDHAWGGGLDIKYFFHRYFGIGFEGYVLDAKKSGFNAFLDPQNEVFIHHFGNDERAIGATLGTLTLRYPVPCTRFAPYAWGGLGAIFGGGESDTMITHPFDESPNEFPTVNAHSRHYDGETKLLGQIGAGLEVRITKHIGWINDFAWNMPEGPKNNFGQFRSGLNFAF
jgi:hypothetical protein